VRAALFDMDRTLVRVNTGNLYVRWRMRRKEAGLRDVIRVGVWMAQYTLGLIDAAKISAQALTTLAGLEEERFAAECRDWYAEDVRRHVADHARAEVERRRRDGWTCAILSASTPYVTRPLADDLGIDHVICTKLEVREGRFTGDYERPLCYGAGKVEAAGAWARTHGVDLAASAFFTDSVSDLPMLEHVGEPRVINPDPRLRLAAYRRGWPVETWR
jgi:HAD superfamily hydrolase (TIGR01490 family)